MNRKKSSESYFSWAHPWSILIWHGSKSFENNFRSKTPDFYLFIGSFLWTRNWTDKATLSGTSFLSIFTLTIFTHREGLSNGFTPVPDNNDVNVSTFQNQNSSSASCGTQQGIYGVTSRAFILVLIGKAYKLLYNILYHYFDVNQNFSTSWRFHGSKLYKAKELWSWLGVVYIWIFKRVSFPLARYRLWAPLFASEVIYALSQAISLNWFITLKSLSR